MESKDKMTISEMMNHADEIEKLIDDLDRELDAENEKMAAESDLVDIAQAGGLKNEYRLTNASFVKFDF